MSFHVHLGVWSEKCLVYLVARQSDIDTQAERIIKEGMRETDFHPGIEPTISYWNTCMPTTEPQLPDKSQPLHFLILYPRPHTTWQYKVEMRKLVFL